MFQLKAAPAASSAAGARHTHVGCTGCGQYPIIGARYRSQSALSENLCTPCVQTGFYKV